jgi:hypothetical protein
MTDLQTPEEAAGDVLVGRFTEVQQNVDQFVSTSEVARRSLGTLRVDLRKATAAARGLSRVCENRLQTGELHQISEQQREAVRTELVKLGTELRAMQNYFNNTAGRDFRRLQGYFDTFPRIETYHPTKGPP